MLFDTVAEYDAEILEVRGYLKEAMKQQSFVSGGPGQGMHSQRGRVQEISDYLSKLSAERETLLNRQAGPVVTHVEFGRES